MLAIGLEPVQIDPAQASTRKDAFLALAAAAQHYLHLFEELEIAGRVPPGAAAITRIRGTGPGVCFGALLRALFGETELSWESPFEGSRNVSGTAIRGAEVLCDPARTDGFLALRFAPSTRDLALHIHPSSDRFIFAIEGRGFFHVSPGKVDDAHRQAIHHAAVRDRDALMFRRGAVHTFSTAEHPLTLLSYHQPFIELDDPAQYVLVQPILLPSEFLSGVGSRVSFDAGWTLL